MNSILFAYNLFQNVCVLTLFLLSGSLVSLLYVSREIVTENSILVCDAEWEWGGQVFENKGKRILFLPADEEGSRQTP